MSIAMKHPLPEFEITSTMRTAANTVAASFHAYQQSCFDLPKQKDAEAIKKLLISQRERKDAYQLAMKFLSTAALKANPAYQITAQSDLTDAQSQELSLLLEAFLEKRLNELVKEESDANPLIKNTAAHHPVIAGPW